MSPTTLLDAKAPFSVSGIVDRAWNTVAEAAFRTGWTPITRLAEAAVVAYVLFLLFKKKLIGLNGVTRLMKNIKVGQLRVLTYSHIYTFPIPDPGSEQQAANARPDLNAELRVVNNAFWVRLCAMGDLGFAEAYMYGDVECNDLVSLFQVRNPW